MPETADVKPLAEQIRDMTLIWNQGRAVGFNLRALAEVIAEHDAALLRDAVGDLVPGLRAEAERLRGIDVISIALWMETEADRLELVIRPTDNAPVVRCDLCTESALPGLMVKLCEDHLAEFKEWRSEQAIEPADGGGA